MKAKVKVYSKARTLKEAYWSLEKVTEYQMEESCANCGEDFEFKGDTKKEIEQEVLSKLRYVHSDGGGWIGFACLECIEEGLID